MADLPPIIDNAAAAILQSVDGLPPVRAMKLLSRCAEILQAAQLEYELNPVPFDVAKAMADDLQADPALCNVLSEILAQEPDLLAGCAVAQAAIARILQLSDAVQQ